MYGAFIYNIADFGQTFGYRMEKHFQAQAEFYACRALEFYRICAFNGGFFVLEPDIMDYIEGDSTVWEKEPLQRLAQDETLSAYKHYGFWHPMDTLRDKNVLEQLWASGNPPWKVWE